MVKIKVIYDGKYPNLCSGNLEVITDDTLWKFPKYCLRSGGSVSFDDNWNEHVCEGEWSIRDWPEEFPEELKTSVLKEINYKIPHGCCGGCV